MIHDVLSAAGHSVWSAIMVVVVILVFAGVIYWALSGGRHRFDHESRLPLNDESSAFTESDVRRTQP